MRTMLKIQLPAVAGNAAIADNSLPTILQRLMEQVKPEAAYFYAEGGRRAALMVFDMTESSQIPPIVEPLFMGMEATVDLIPVMNAQELQDGLAAWAAASA